MTLKEVETFLKEKCVSYTTNIYNYINAEIAIKDLNEYTSLIMVDKIGIRFMEYQRSDCLGMNKYIMLDFYLYNSTISSMDISKIKALAYVEWNKPKEEEPITMEQKLDKFYEELIKPFLIKVVKDIYKEINKMEREDNNETIL